MIRKSVIGLFMTISLVFANKVEAQHLNPEQENSFRQKIEELIKTYTEAHELSFDGISVDQGMLRRFRGAFINSDSQVIYNDLLPEAISGDTYLTPADYVDFATRHYPTGIDVSVQIERIDILSRGDAGSCEAIVRIKKTARGLYLDRRIHNWSGKLYFFVEGSMSAGVIQSVGIKRIADDRMHRQVQANWRFEGLYVGLSGGYNQNMLYSTEVIGNNYWDYQMGTGIIPGLEIHYMFTRRFGLGTGIRLGSYSPMLYLEEYSEELSETFTDIDNDRYYPIYDISGLEEANQIRSLEIPLLMKFRTGTKTVGLYFDIGAVFSSYQSVTYSLSGNVTRKGRYPDYGDVILEDIPEYDFFTNQSVDSEDNEISVSSMGISGLLSVGLSIAVYNDIMIKLGVAANYGLTDIYNGSAPEYSYNFFNTTGNSPGEVFLHSASIEFGIYYRIF